MSLAIRRSSSTTKTLTLDIGCLLDESKEFFSLRSLGISSFHPPRKLFRKGVDQLKTQRLGLARIKMIREPDPIVADQEKSAPVISLKLNKDLAGAPIGKSIFQ